MKIVSCSKMSEVGHRFLIEREGCRLEIYKDVGGYATIGVGHLLSRSEQSSGMLHVYGSGLVRHKINIRNGISQPEAISILKGDLLKFEDVVANYVLIQLQQHQFDALVSFSFNVGVSAFKNSTLLKRLNQSLFTEVPTQLRRWRYSNGVVYDGLINRREFEINLWNGEIHE
ncbi:MAG: lysozyme [Thiomargarita sp.]|nr:lysozyme [Thiomargarita sp.]